MWFIAIGSLAYFLYHVLGIEQVALPIAPVSIVGVAIAIFLGFRNSSAYDRWWEARKIWGGIVNTNRSWAMEVTSFVDAGLEQHELKDECRRLIYRQLAWNSALEMHLRNSMEVNALAEFLDDKELVELANKRNIPSQLLNLQSKHLQRLYRKNVIEDFSRIELNSLLKEFYNLQGRAERINNTVFPYYYNYFTRLFLWLFMAILPFALVDIMEYAIVPLSVAISFVFHILDKSGAITEDPFMGRAADTPMKALCRTIEIDLRQMLGEEDIPGPYPTQYTKYGAAYID
ncbi:MAG: bestrophin family ion channel [Salibacteraceae bacterium]